MCICGRTQLENFVLCNIFPEGKTAVNEAPHPSPAKLGYVTHGEQSNNDFE